MSACKFRKRFRRKIYNCTLAIPANICMNTDRYANDIRYDPPGESILNLQGTCHYSIINTSHRIR
jgi:hypothetical protein